MWSWRLQIEKLGFEIQIAKIRIKVLWDARRWQNNDKIKLKWIRCHKEETWKIDDSFWEKRELGEWSQNLKSTF